MTHIGLPWAWAWVSLAVMILLSLWILFREALQTTVLIERPPKISKFTLNTQMKRRLLLSIRAVMALLFIVLISVGFIGNPIPERNLSIVLTWTLWWSGLVVAVFFTGSFWCAICPWDTIASWLVKRKIFYRSGQPYSLEYKVPAGFRNLLVASFLVVLLTWFELGYGITVSPYATSIMALGFVVAATVSMLIFERKAFCQYFCPVGRTIGMYSELSIVALRPIDTEVCATCNTLECYHGNELIEPCPTHQVMGRMQSNASCISCAQCVFSCPHTNVAWKTLRFDDVLLKAKRHNMSQSIFLLILLSLTLLHGLTMLPVWEYWINSVATWSNDSGRLMFSFTLLMMALIVMVLSAVIFVHWVSMKLLYTSLQNSHTLLQSPNRLREKQKLYQWLGSSQQQLSEQQGPKQQRMIHDNSLPDNLSFRLFFNFSFATLAITFAYHIAHNVTHLSSEVRNLGPLLLNPFGTDLKPLSASAMLAMHESMVVKTFINILQSSLIVVAFAIGLKVILVQAKKILLTTGIDKKISFLFLMPSIILLLFLASCCLWLLTQPMMMRTV
ncbi:hypothetical protein MNBD_GAMMA12-1230 [hydrothermal vent metagenome]|uniref:4Fe-4S ferredoxin-type domain-containing protein n=1 Tax=hydrothermal vent metagenome TaxID=652676 RepID=A0A3B0YL58_9ZZZZ